MTSPSSRGDFEQPQAAMASSRGTILVVGANGGLGGAIVRRIVETPDLSSQYNGVFVVRSAEKATALKGTLAGTPGSFHHETVSMDLSRLSSIREGAKAINAQVANGSLGPIRALIISAGFQEPTAQTFTPDGCDMTFQVNYLAPFLLVLLLLQSVDKEHGRIVIVNGWDHNTEDSRNDTVGLYKDEKYKVIYHDTDSLAKGTWSSLKDDPSHLSGRRRYGASHLLAVMFILELQKRLNADPELSKIAVLGLDPGAMPTGICRRDPWFVRVVVQRFIFPILNPISVYFSPNGFFRSPAKSAKDVIRAAFETEALGAEPKGLYLNGSNPWSPSKEAHIEQNRERAWKDSVGYAKLTAGDTVLQQWS